MSVKPLDPETWSARGRYGYNEANEKENEELGGGRGRERETREQRAERLQKAVRRFDHQQALRIGPWQTATPTNRSPTEASKTHLSTSIWTRMYDLSPERL